MRFTIAGVYFGTTSGEVWGSRDEGRNWRRLAEHLPEIYAVEAGVGCRVQPSVAIPTPASFLHRRGGARRGRASQAKRRGCGCVRGARGRYPGIRFRMVDEAGRVRPHIQVFVGMPVQRDP